MGDLHDPRLMYLKAVLFVLIGLMSGGIILLESPSLRVAVLLFLCVWGFARAYYFAFYVVEHYIDSSFKYASLTSFAIYLMNRGKMRH